MIILILLNNNMLMSSDENLIETNRIIILRSIVGMIECAWANHNDDISTSQSQNTYYTILDYVHKTMMNDTQSHTHVHLKGQRLR